MVTGRPYDVVGPMLVGQLICSTGVPPTALRRAGVGEGGSETPAGLKGWRLLPLLGGGDLPSP